MVTDLKPQESGKVIGWLVGWPENDPRIFGKIIGVHGKSGTLMATFKRGLPGEALGGPVTIIEAKPKIESKRKSDKSINISEIEGIGPKYKDQLASQKIYTIVELLDAGATPEGRKTLAEKTGISPKLILEWVNIADLFRIKGVGEEYADLLEEAGVDTVKELATRNPENLHKKIEEVNKAKKLVRRTPSASMVKAWIEEATTLPRKIEY
jgi:predicted flap endonuclease-1-like 5' DNA nuclease